MRLIDADAFSEQYGNYYAEQGTAEGFIGTVGELIAEAPAVDAEPVRHGHWKPIGARLRGGNTDSFQCSECEFLARALKAGKECGYDFCPNCGARMDGETK